MQTKHPPMIKFSEYFTPLIVSPADDRIIFRAPPWAIPITPSLITARSRVSVFIVNCHPMEITRFQLAGVALAQVDKQLPGVLEK